MKFNLTQKEIEVALRAYIGNQGINTAGKQVNVTFTTSRKGGFGVTAEVDVSDSAIPPIGDDEAPKPKLVAVTAPVVVQAAPEAPAEAPVDPAPVETVAEAPVEAQPAVKPVSLFG